MIRAWLFGLLLILWITLHAVEARDGSDQWIRLDAPARRVVTLSPHTTELVFAVEGGDCIVGTVEWSDYPPEAKRIPRIGDATRLDRERLLGLHPDLVIAWSGGNRLRDLDWLERRGIAVYRSDPRRLREIADDMEAIARLLGLADKGHAAAAAFRRRLERLRQGYRDAEPFRYFYQLWPRPLTTVGGASLIGQALTLCKGENFFARLETPSITVGREAVISGDPDVIIAPQEKGEVHAPFTEWRRWKNLRAVAGNRLYTVPADLMHRPTPRLLDGIERLCGKIQGRQSNTHAPE
ncbi:MAG TPA: cobalamin-binding protein [Chromatiales bacterium]|nr:cobalamin-binding protein [Chromatiales bacterium]